MQSGNPMPAPVISYDDDEDDLNTGPFCDPPAAELLLRQPIAHSWSTSVTVTLAASPLLSDDAATPARARAAPSPRFGHAAVALPNNKMLVFSGRGADGFTPDLWLYCMIKGTWDQIVPHEPQAPWPTGRCGHTMTLVSGGSYVLMYGGATSFTDTTTEMWELCTHTMKWSLLDSGPPVLPSFNSASSHGSTDVLSAATPVPATGASLPTTLPFTSFAPMLPHHPNAVAAWQSFASQPPLDTEFSTGQQHGVGTDDVGVSLPSPQSWSGVTPSSNANMFPAVVPHSDAAFIVTLANSSFSSAAAVAPSAPTPLLIRPMNRKGHTAVHIGGRVLVYGGVTQDGVADPHVWAWHVSTFRWSLIRAVTRAPVPRRYHCAEVTHDGQMIIFGGQRANPHEIDSTGDSSAAETGGEFLNDVHLFNPVTRVWRAVLAKGLTLPEPRMCCTSLLRAGALCIFDGAAHEVLHQSNYELHLATNTWRRLGPQAIPKTTGANRGTTVVSSNIVTMFGGHTGEDFSNEVVQLHLEKPTLKAACVHWLEQHSYDRLQSVPWVFESSVPPPPPLDSVAT